jgi:hypothetical protein
MAYENGTATDHRDLQAKIETFATANGWTAERSTYGASSDGELILSSTGSSGSDEIVAGFRSTTDAGVGYYNLALRGFRGFDGSAWGNLPEPSPEVYLVLDDATIAYWLMVNDDRILMVTKIGTTFETAYLGFIRAFSTDDEHAFPMLVGGATDVETRALTDTTGMESWWKIGVDLDEDVGHIYRPDGTWGELDDSIPWQHMQSNVRNGVGTEVLFPGMPYRFNPDGVYGEYDGVFWISGFAVNAEDTVTINSQDYLVVPDINRTGRNQFCAVELA